MRRVLPLSPAGAGYGENIVEYQTVELFAGLKSFSTVAAQRGFPTFTVDIDPDFGCDVTGDILHIDPSALPQRPLILWASPPCEAFSIAAISHNWNPDYSPTSHRAITGLALLSTTVNLITALKPTYWFIENPRGMMRKTPLMRLITETSLYTNPWHPALGKVARHTITYCQYGDTRMKPTDIWTNAIWWKPRPACSPSASCHEAAPRGSKTGTQGIKTYAERSRIPSQLFEDIFNQMPSHQALNTAA